MSANGNMNGVRLGEILVQQGLLNREEVSQVLQTQKSLGRPFGVLAERMFGLDPRSVESAWVAQYAQLAKCSDPEEFDVDRACIGLVNRRQAWQFQIAPIARDGDELVVVTDEKHLAKALRYAAATFKDPVFFRVVESGKLQSFLMKHYPVPAFLAEYALAR